MANSTYQYQAGEHLGWIQPEEGISAIAVGYNLTPAGMEVEDIVVVMEPGPYDFVPYFAVICKGEVARKYPAHRVFCAGRA